MFCAHPKCQYSSLILFVFFHLGHRKVEFPNAPDIPELTRPRGQPAQQQQQQDQQQQQQQ